MSVRAVSGENRSFHDFEPTAAAVAEYLGGIIRPPGYWEADESCKQLKPVGFCERGHVQIGGENPCSTRTCPHHWYQWRRRAAINLIARLAAVRKLAGGPESRARRLVHFVNAPDQEQRWTTNRFWNQRSESYEKAQAVGVRAGVAIPHPYRVSDAGDELFRLLGGSEAQSGKWRVIREYTDTWDDLEPLVDVAPHVHHLALAKDIDGDEVEALEAETGWVSKNIRSLARFYVDEDEIPLRHVHGDDRTKEEMVRDGYEDMAKLSMYLLSHAAVQPKTGELPQRNTVTYWGEVHSVSPSEDLPDGVWAQIQRQAAAAVRGVAPEELEDDGLGRECSREDCEQPVRPLSALPGRLSDPDHSWWDGLEFEQQCELLGAAQWMSHKPPPGIEGGLPPGGFRRSPRVPDGVRTEEAVIEWLRDIGRKRYHRKELPFLTVAMSP